MKLEKIEINNFLSIPYYFELLMYPRCRVLVGINEVGKSNILRALSMLCKSIKPSSSDRREPLPGEGPYEEETVRFIFKLNENEFKEIFNTITKQILCSDFEKPLFLLNKKKLSLKKFLKNKEVIYEIDLKDLSKKTTYWALSKDYKVLPNWKKPNTDPTINYTIGDKNKIDLNQMYLIDTEKYKKIPKEYLKEVNADYINQIIGQELVKYLNNNLPECIFWKYEEKNILPSKINLNQFAANPDTCLPLKYMFQLAKYDDINLSFNEAKQRSPAHGINNLLNRVAEKSTKHFRSIWKEYKSVEFYLKQNGENIDIAIKDTKNLYGFEKRSEGFKRFVTFLLMISARVKEDFLRNTLILIDEPSIGLHPSAEKYIRDELINISKTNYVVYSTHSIFMIDKNNIPRHVIIKKKDEQTYAVEAKESNVFDEEVLYKALGASVFEVLKQKNILFEGWRDKKLFQAALKKSISRQINFKKIFKDVGLAHSIGVKFMRYITPVFEAANRDCFILSDNDEPAKRYQKDFNEENLYGDWKRYDELLPDLQEITAEDFIKKDIIIKAWKNKKQDYTHLCDLNIAELSDDRGVIYVLKRKIRTCEIDGNKQKEILNSIKEYIFSELKPSHIDDNYFNLLEQITRHLGLL